MQEQVTSLIITDYSCTALVIGDMNTTSRADDRTSERNYPPDVMCATSLSLTTSHPYQKKPLALDALASNKQRC